MSIRVLVVGNITIDHIFTVDTLPLRHRGALVEKRRVCFGGRGANICLALAKLGLSPSLLAVAGKDFLETGYRDYLVENGVDASRIVLVDSKLSASTHVFLDHNSGSFFYFFEPNVQNEFQTIDTDSLRFRDYEYLFVTPGDEDFIARLINAIPSECFLLVGLGEEVYREPDGLFSSVLRKARVVFIKDTEVGVLTKKLRLNSAEDIFRIGSSLECMVVTEGKRGSTISSRGGVQHIPAIRPNSIVSSLGCRDAYVAGFIYGVAKKLSWAASAHLGAAVSSFVCESIGCQQTLPNLTVAIARLRAQLDVRLFGQLFGIGLDPIRADEPTPGVIP